MTQAIGRNSQYLSSFPVVRLGNSAHARLHVDQMTNAIKHQNPKGSAITVRRLITSSTPNATHKDPTGKVTDISPYSRSCVGMANTNIESDTVMKACKKIEELDERAGGCNKLLLEELLKTAPLDWKVISSLSLFCATS
jgi:hypothetical protein